MLEGPRLISEALDVSLRPSVVAVAEGGLDLPAVRDVLDRLATDDELAGTEVLVVADAALESLASTATPQPMVALVDRPVVSVPATLGPDDLVVVLVGVADPGNVGTIVRSAGAVGARAVVMAGGADPWGPKVVRASAGAVLRVPVCRERCVRDVLQRLRDAGATVVASDANADEPHTSGALSDGPLVLVVGSEAHGLNRAELAPLVHRWVRIPMADGIESLNAAMAATVLLYEARRNAPALHRGTQAEA